MKNYQKNILSEKIITPTLLILGIIFFSFFSAIANHISFIYSIKFSYFQIFAILIPGIALTLSFNKKNISTIKFYGLSYCFGYIINIIEYYLLYPFNLKQYSLYVTIIAAILSLIFIIQNRNNFEYIQQNTKDTIICMVFISSLLVLLFFAYNCNNLMPNLIRNGIYYSDLSFWTGNTISAEHGYIPIDLRTADQPLFYHFFSNLQLALVKTVTGLSAAHLSYCFQYIEPVLILTFSSLILFKEVLKKDRYVILAMLALFFTAGLEDNTLMYFTAHILIAPFGFDISIGFALLTIYFIFLQIKDSKFNLKLFIISFICFIVTTGSKGPVGAVVLCGIGIYCLILLFKKHNIKTGLIYGLSFLISFIFLFCFVLSNPAASESSSSTQLSINWLGTIFSSSYFNNFNNYLQSIHIPGILSKTITLFYWLLSNQVFIYSLVIISVLFLLFNRNLIDNLDIVLFTITLAGVIATLLIKQEGLSQMYFIIGSYPFALLLGMKNYAKLKTKIIKSNIIKYIFNFGSLVLLVIVFINFTKIIYPYVNTGFMNITKKGEMAAPSVAESVNSYDYEALLYLKNNSEENAVVLCDKPTICNLPKFFSYSIFCERQMYLEGYSYSSLSSTEVSRRQDIIKHLFNNDTDAIKSAKEDGVNYIIQSKYYTPDFKSPNNCTLLFENQTIRIYKIN